MPLYEFQCTQCQNTETLLMKISDAPPTQCKQCGGAVEKKVSAPSFVLQGDGWYKDGYGSKKPTETNKSAAPKDCQAQSSCPATSGTCGQNS